MNNMQGKFDPPIEGYYILDIPVDTIYLLIQIY